MKYCPHCFGNGCSICSVTGPHVDLSNLPDLSSKRPFEDGPNQPPYRAGKKSVMIGRKPPAPQLPTIPATATSMHSTKWRGEMDRYFIYVEGETQECDLEVVPNPNGEWVKFSDVEALQVRVRELEEVIKTAWENSVPWGEYVGEESGKHMRIIHISDEAYQALHGIGYDLYQQSLKGTP